ncbi:MAG TPA: glycosyltransferase family 4 protein [Candidatus Limnocylindria bacterium]|nr:glycosyltransferase family 4 protein [Candidatus Limnocylindria bacterium]
MTGDVRAGRNRLRIGLISGPMVRIPPPGYAGTERIVAVLLEELVNRGHDVTLIGPGDSDVPCRVIPTIDHALWTSGMRGDATPYVQVTIETAWSAQHEFDVMHSHLDTLCFSLARHATTPVVHTLHGRLDLPGLPELFAEFTDIPLIAISESQRRWHPENNWLATVHHGLPLEQAPFSAEPGDYLAFVGRIAPEKGVDVAIELARRTDVPLRIAAKVHEVDEEQLFERHVAPALKDGHVTFEGELASEPRDELMAGALATVMLGAWPEPFGLVAIESMATGTPVIARRAGALPEIIRHGENGFLIDDIGEADLAVREAAKLDRAKIRSEVIERFSVERMVDEYEDVYRMLARGSDDRRNGSARPSIKAVRNAETPVA